ncbi:ATPase, F0 complex, subunit A, partial [Piptocephalis cylindrospora]
LIAFNFYTPKYNSAILPNNGTLIKESIYDTVLAIVKDQIGKKDEKYFPFILSLFLFILFSNLIGMVPYSFTITSQIILTLSLSIAIIIGVTILGFYIHKLTFLSLFIPVGTPLGLVPLLVLIELISYLARAVSLGVRLAANVIAGHILLKILSTFIYNFIKQSILFFIIGFLPILIFTALVGLELAIAVLQAIVFIILTCSYIRDAIYLH